MSYTTLTTTVMIFVAVTSVYSSNSDHNVSTFLAQERFDEAIILAERLIESDETLLSVKATIMLTMAQFYEHDVGAYDQAVELYERLHELPLSPDTLIRKETDASLERLLRQQNTFANIYGILDEISQSSATRQEAVEKIQILRELRKKNPDFPEPETIGYYLGLYYYLDKQYARAYRTLNNAITERRAVEIKLPNLPRLRYQAKQKWVETFSLTAAWSVIGGFILVTTVIFLAAKPWRWIGLRHVVLILIVTVAWYGVFTFSSRRTGSSAQESVADTQGEITSEFSTFGNPAEGAFKALFRYGLLGTLGIAVFAIATARLRLRWTVVVINGVVAFLLFSSLMVVFYERYGRQGRTHLPVENPGLFDRLKTVILYTTDEIEPFLLTNPTAFPNINIMTIHDPATREWFIPYLVKMNGVPNRNDENIPSEDG